MVAPNMNKNERDALPGAIADVLLPHLARAQIEAIYRAAPGDEIGSGKFSNPESSAALVANAFGFFLNCPTALPALPDLDRSGWLVTELSLERQIRFPWSGGRHPCLDVVARTSKSLIGLESKRYEPYRPKQAKKHSSAYRRDVWGRRMDGYAKALALTDNRKDTFACLDAAQLAKHAFAIRTQVHRPADQGRAGILYYLYADPWPGPTASRCRSNSETSIERT